MSWRDKHDFQPEILTDPATVKCLGDLVLVRPFDVAPDSIIVDPGTSMTKDGRWVQNRPQGNRLGTVVAAGKGDKMIGLYCEDCAKTEMRIVVTDQRMKRMTCACGGQKLTISHNGHALPARAEMPVAIGDVVIFPRVPANELELNGEEYVFLHAEQHILGIVEGMDKAA
jgi:co-chaperonin GroES (HSP10)